MNVSHLIEYWFYGECKYCVLNTNYNFSLRVINNFSTKLCYQISQILLLIFKEIFMGRRRTYIYIYYSQYAFIYAWNENRDVIYILFLPHHTIILYKFMHMWSRIGWIENERRSTWKHTCMNMFAFTGKPLSILYIYEEVANITTPTTLFLPLHIFHFCFFYMKTFSNQKRGFIRVRLFKWNLNSGIHFKKKNNFTLTLDLFLVLLLLPFNLNLIWSTHLII